MAESLQQINTTLNSPGVTLEQVRQAALQLVKEVESLTRYVQQVQLAYGSHTHAITFTDSNGNPGSVQSLTPYPSGVRGYPTFLSLPSEVDMGRPVKLSKPIKA